MKPEAVRKIMMLQAVEEADEADLLLSPADKSSAAELAGAPLEKNSGTGSENAFLEKRADALLVRLAARHPEAARWTQTVASNHRLGILTLVLGLIAAVIGFLTNELGPDKRINILSFPLLGIIFWSLLVYIREIVLFFRSREKLFSDSRVDWLIGMMQPPRREQGKIEKEEQRTLAGSESIFEKRWKQITAPVIGARLKSLLHTTALILAAAAIAGMYVKGLANEYTAVWESTFFETSSQLRPILQTVLGPATAISGGEIPSVEELDTIRMSGGAEVTGQNAARWIHWYAITIGLFVLIPRFIFALIWRIKASALARSLPFRDLSSHYYEHLLAISTGHSIDVHIIPYGLDPTDARKRLAIRALEDQFEKPLKVTWNPPIAFGEEEDFTLTDAPEGSTLVPLYSLASTPEKETHLAVYQTLSGHAPNPVGNSQVKWALIDPESYDEKLTFLPDAGKRRIEREAAWTKLFETENLELIFVGRSPSPLSEIPS